jgi:hypothetical protein
MQMRNEREFQEVAHCGGKITFRVRTRGEDRQYSVEFSHQSPTPAALVGLYALPQGIPVQGFAMGGIGMPWRPSPPTSDSIPVLIASDREAMFGRRCSACSHYWRSRSASALWPTICPYCGRQDGMHAFTTDAQLRYIEHYTQTLVEAINGDETEAEVVIDMDQYADLANSEVERPAFYHAEESQQSRWRCSKCGNEDDILGHYGYCSSCGYRNNAELLSRDLAAIRERCQTGEGRELLKDLVSHFEGFSRDLVERLGERVPLTPTRRNIVRDLRFHDVSHARNALLDVFGIDIFRGLNDEQKQFVQIKFLRRNLYEHRAGVADEAYLDASGDTVRLGQRLSEHAGEIRRLVDMVGRTAGNLDEGFHAILPPRNV